MRDDILLNLDNPRQLEQLYRNNKPTFKSAFNALYPQVSSNPLAEGWYQRLNYGSGNPDWGTRSERVFVAGAAVLSAFLAKLPEMLSLEPDLYFQRNVSFVVFPVLITYFAWKNGLNTRTVTWLSGMLLASVVFINVLPQNSTGDTLLLSCLHLPFFLWSLLGFAFSHERGAGDDKWLGFLRYNGELAVMMALLLISGGITSALTINLFGLIGWNIEKPYFNYVVICGLAAVPVVSTFITRVQPGLVSKVSPVIARLFSPVALVMLVLYLGATLFSEKDPFHDREFLIIFNALLVGVMALIFFSVAEAGSTTRNRTQILILSLLSAVTLVVNGIALSAVLFRITEWGITPNRLAVLGANLLMLAHLVYVAVRLFGALTRRSDVSLVGASMALFLPVYSIWSAVVVFLFPLIFAFK
ncbi:hypothetical protein [Dyadobacter sandarakinus]|uniref:DUF4153 domain-containing protein n=1 Tax=Dyadobacter sandarakinus TaxID=2747268 RepID=A0ABX7I5C7_9BACT|nr:hypothetical protein [Dyadobacter sandarakinus]QRR01145.1 hypothetical protein HWI92_09625 [Dyadobacter sandarakinus]